MNLKNVIIIYISAAFFISCIDLYTGPTESDDNIIQHYNMYTFTSPDSKGLYLIDPRPVFKNMIYHYDLATKEWTAVATRDQLTISDHYDILDIATANIIKNNKLVILGRSEHYFSNKGKLYEYDLNEKKLSTFNLLWPNLYEPNYYNQYDSSYNISSLIYNKFSNQLYYVDDSFLYLLNERYEFEKKCKVPLGNLAVFFPRFDFISSDTLVTLTSEYPKSYIYPEIDPDLIENKKLVIHKTNISTMSETTFRHNFLDSLDEKYIHLGNFVNGTIVTFNFNQYTSDGILIKKMNLLTNYYSYLPKFNNLVDGSKNPNNVWKWSDIVYQQFNFFNYIQKDNSLYLFNNENGFLLQPTEYSWEPLPPPDFLKLNQKK